MAEYIDLALTYWELLVGAQLHVLLFWATVWAVVIGIAGAIAGLVLFLLVRRTGVLKTAWPYGRAVRVAVAIVLVLSMGAGMAAIGGFQGALSNTPSTVRESNFGKSGLIIAGRATAAAFFTVHYLLLALDPDTLEVNQTEALEAEVADTIPAVFLALLEVTEKELELTLEAVQSDAPRPPALMKEAWLQAIDRGLVLDFELMSSNASRLTDTMLTATVGPVKAEVLPYFPEMLREKAESAVEWVLVAALESMLLSEVAGAIDDRIPGLSDILDDYIDGLDDVAEETGTDSDVTFGELKDHTIDALILPVLVLPIKYLVRSQQLTFALLLALALALAVGVIPTINAIIRWRAGKSPPESKDTNPTPA